VKAFVDEFRVSGLIILEQGGLEAFFAPAFRDMDFLRVSVLSADKHRR
jgi:hypothetical protein